MMLKLEAVVLCAPGQVRDQNQDNYYLNGTFREAPDDSAVYEAANHGECSGFYAVADGMGGESHGEIASWLAVRSLPDLHELSVEGVSRYLLDRSEEISRYMDEHGGASGGTTFVSLFLHDDSAEIVNVGDSRAYLLRDGRLMRLTEDHTAMQQMVDAGRLEPGNVVKHPARHILTQSLGISNEDFQIEPYTLIGQIQEGDLFLLCSDGLYDMVSENAIGDVLRSEADITSAAHMLYQMAMEGGGRDNITVLLVKPQMEE